MNERIKELLDEACEYAHSKHFAHVKKFKYVTPDQHANAQDTMQEKFAELIVRECAGICEKDKKGFPDSDSVKQGLADMIKQHFGVEE